MISDYYYFSSLETFDVRLDAIKKPLILYGENNLILK